MSFSLDAIVLYGVDGRRRVLPLRVGEVNVITGASKTGKSALIDIVDYCFGSTACSVPEGVIRQHVRWYAVRLSIGDEQVFVARRAPQLGETANNDIHFERASSVEIPDASDLRPTIGLATLVDLLSLVSGVRENLNEPEPGQTRAPLSATVRHALFFTFQQQDEIISRKNLFHRQGEQFIPQAIRDVLPYFLGVVADDFFAKQNELRRAQELLRDKQRRANEAEALAGAGLGRAASLLAEARDVGLVVDETTPTDLEAGLQQIRAIVAMPIDLQNEELQAGAALNGLRVARSTLSAALRRKKDELAATQALAADEQAFSREAQEHVARLRSVELFSASAVHGVQCPLCESSLTARVASVDDLTRALQKTSQQLETVAASVPHIRGLISKLERDVAKTKRELGENREAIDAVESSREDLAAFRDQAARRAHVIGRMSLYLESIRVTDDTSSLVKSLQEAQDRVSTLQAQMGSTAIAEKLQSVASLLAIPMTAWAQELKLEHSDYPMRFEPSKLTVVSDTPAGPLLMERMGSGETWVSCHVIAHLALHQWFAGQRRPVPRFLFLDQPSQVYFPPEKDVKDGSLAVLKDEDREAVGRLFRLIFRIAREAGIQVILTEHADIAEPWFQDAVVERWRGGPKLIPAEWLSPS